MYLNLGLSIALKDFKLFRIEDVDFESTVDDFKTRVAAKVNFLKENIELCYCGRILDGSTTLSYNGLREGFVLNILQKKEKEASQIALPALESEIPDLVRVFQILASRNAYRSVLQKLNKAEMLDNIISTTPGLCDDPTAIVILQHPELLAKLADTAAVKKVVEKHPTLANAARNLVAAVQSDTSPSTSSSSQNLSNSVVPFVMGSDDEEMDLPMHGNGDLDSRTPENSQEGEQPVNLITTSQVAAALASTTAANSRSSTEPHGNTSLTRASLGITPEMMSAALQSVIASTSSASAGAGPSSSQQESQEQPQPQPQPQPQEGNITATKLEELRKLGFLDDAINIQALELANGDLELAANIILSGSLNP